MHLNSKSTNLNVSARVEQVVMSLRRIGFRGMITSTIHVLILVPVFFVMLKEHALKRNGLPKP